MRDKQQIRRVLRRLTDWRRREKNREVRAALKALSFASAYGRSGRVAEFLDLALLSQDPPEE